MVEIPRGGSPEQESQPLDELKARIKERGPIHIAGQSYWSPEELDGKIDQFLKEARASGSITAEKIDREFYEELAPLAEELKRVLVHTEAPPVNLEQKPNQEEDALYKFLLSDVGLSPDQIHYSYELTKGDGTKKNFDTREELSFFVNDLPPRERGAARVRIAWDEKTIAEAKSRLTEVAAKGYGGGFFTKNSKDFATEVNRIVRSVLPSASDVPIEDVMKWAEKKRAENAKAASANSNDALKGSMSTADILHGSKSAADVLRNSMKSSDVLRNSQSGAQILEGSATKEQALEGSSSAEDALRNSMRSQDVLAHSKSTEEILRESKELADREAARVAGRDPNISPPPPPPRSPEKPPEPPKPEKRERKSAEEALEDTRSAYAKAYKAFAKKKKSEKTPEDLAHVDALKKEYEAAKLDMGFALLNKNADELLKHFVKEFGKPHPEWTANETEAFLGARQETNNEYKRTEIFQKLVIEEQNLLFKAQIDEMPPKERHVARKLLDRWVALPRAYKLAISTALVTGAVALTGGFSTFSGAALFAGSRFARGFASTALGTAVGEKAGKWIEAQTRRRDLGTIEQLREEFSLNSLQKISEGYQHDVLEAASKERRKALILKSVLAMGAGVIAGQGLRFMEHAYLAGTEHIPQPSPRVMPSEPPPKPPYATPSPESTPALRLTDEQAEHARRQLEYPMGKRPLSLAPEEAERLRKEAGIAPSEHPASPAPSPPELEPHGSSRLPEDFASRRDPFIKQSGIPSPDAAEPRTGASPSPEPFGSKSHEPPAAEETGPKPFVGEKSELATIKQGEGAWHAVRRQLEDRGVKPEELNKKTMEILIKEGYVKPDGSEIRIAKPGVKIFLNEDNTLKPPEGEGKLTYEWKPEGKIVPEPATPTEAIEPATEPVAPESTEASTFRPLPLTENAPTGKDPAAWKEHVRAFRDIEKDLHDDPGKYGLSQKDLKDPVKMLLTIKELAGPESQDLIPEKYSKIFSIEKQVLENPGKFGLSQADVHDYEKVISAVKKELGGNFPALLEAEPSAIPESVEGKSAGVWDQAGSVKETIKSSAMSDITHPGEITSHSPTIEHHFKYLENSPDMNNYGKAFARALGFPETSVNTILKEAGVVQFIERIPQGGEGLDAVRRGAVLTIQGVEHPDISIKLPLRKEHIAAAEAIRSLNLGDKIQHMTLGHFFNLYGKEFEDALRRVSDATSKTPIKPFDAMRPGDSIKA